MNTTILKQLEAKGIIEMEIHNHEYKHIIGIRFSNKSLKHSVWHWFNVYDMGESNEFITFDHSYNQCNGKIRKGLMTGIKLKMKIDELAENSIL